jgi:hypothetical protein
MGLLLLELLFAPILFTVFMLDANDEFNSGTDGLQFKLELDFVINLFLMVYYKKLNFSCRIYNCIH